MWPKCARCNFPFSRDNVSPYDSRNRQRVIDFDVPIELDGIEIQPGDLIAADEDGVVIIPKVVEAQVVQAAYEKAQAENHVRDAIRGGTTATEAFQRYGVL